MPRVSFGCDLSQKAEGIAFSEEFQPCIAGHDKHPGHGSHVLSVDLQNVALGTDVAGTLDTTRPSRGGGHANRVATLAQPPTMAVRRLTPRECERLQGFPDDWTLIPYRRGESSESNRYRSLGNSMAVPVMRWIGAQIARVDGE